MLVIGMGHRARQGKDTSAAAMIDACSLETEVRRYAFADALKVEVRAALWDPKDPYWTFLTRTRNARISAFMKRFSLPSSEDGCWEWQGGKTEKGYGYFAGSSGEDWRRWRAHRFMWEIVLGNEPVDIIRHRCDNPGCVCPAHLEPGTAADNSSDMVERGRAQYGEDHPNAYPDSLIADVKAHLELGRPQSDVARLFGLHTSTISRIANEKERLVRPIPKRTQLDWSNSKRFSRPMLQHYGTEYRREADPDYWVKQLAAKLNEHNPEIALITDVRFPNEVAFIKSLGGFVVKCTRTTAPDVQVNEHPSEAELDGFNGWDFYIHADTVADCQEQARDILKRCLNLNSSIPTSRHVPL